MKTFQIFSIGSFSTGFQFYARVVCFLIFALGVSCNSSGKEENTVHDSPDQQAWFVTIKGKVGYPQTGTITIQELKDNGGTGWQDTIQLKKDNTFSKRIRMTEPGYYRLNFYNLQMMNLILDKSDIEVNADGNNAQGFFEVKGSPDLDLIRYVQQKQNSFNESPAITKLNEEFSKAVQQKDEQQIAALQLQYQGMANKESDEIAALLEQKAPSLGVINLLQNNTIDKDRYFKTYVAVADKLKKEWSNYPNAKSFIALVDKMKQTAIGQPAPEISLPNPDGKVISLSSLKGKYVLVDFWAKWCGPCRQENPNVVRVYNKYKDKGFTVFGVSLDRKKEDWVQAIQDDGLTWTHVSDLKFWQSEAAKTYNVNAIPFSLLLDPSGIIIAKNLRGAALEQKLAEVLKDK